MKNKLNQIKKYSLMGVFALAVFLVPRPAHATWIPYTHNEPYTVVGTPPPANSVTLTANPTSINLATDPGQTSLRWTINGSTATGCTASSTPTTTWTGSVASAQGIHGPQTVAGLSVGHYEFDISCTTSSGPTPIVDQAFVDVINQPPGGNNVLATIFANQQIILAGGQSELTWGSTNATSCVGNGFSTGPGNAIGGSLWVSPIVDTTYAVDCSDSSTPPNQASASTVLKILKINYFQTSANYCVSSPFLNPKFAWDAPNATSCTITRSGGGLEAVANSSRLSGGVYNNGDGRFYYTSTLPVVPPSSTYTLTCSSRSLSVSQQLVVPICSTPQTEDFSLSATPTTQTLSNNTAIFTVFGSPISGFTGDIDLSMGSSPLPRGTTYDFYPTTLTCNGLSCSSSMLTVTTPPSLISGVYTPIVISGYSSSLNSTHTATVTINATGKKRPIFREF